MSGGLFTPGGLSIPQTYGAGYASGRMGVAVTPSATINTKGGWAEITSSTTGLLQSCTTLLLKVYVANQFKASDFAWEVDIGIGVNGNVQTILPKLDFGNFGANGMFWLLQLKLPVALPAGTHVWARAAAIVASSTTLIQAALATFDSGFTDTPDCCAFDALGSASVGLGTSIATTSAGTPTAWVSFSSGTVRDYNGLFILVNPGANQETRVYLDVAIGSPQNIILPFVYVTPITGAATGFATNLLPVSIPQGSTVWVRGYNIIGNNDTIRVMLYAGYK